MDNTLIMTEHDHARLSQLLDAPPSFGADAVEEAQRRMLIQKLQQATVKPPTEVPRNLVTMRSLVQLRDLERNEKFSCTLSFPDEADPTRYQVSVLAPLGTTMVGSRVGDVLSCETAAGSRQLRVERVYYQPEAAGDFHL